MFKVRSLLHRPRLVIALCLVLTGVSLNTISQEQTEQPELSGISHSTLDENLNEEVVSFSYSFFDRYQPSTALDMVRQIPGFQIDDGSGLRGFGGVTGNILINNRRPSAKQDLPSAILSRIPSGNVAHIELIRGQVPGIDLQGRAVVANIVLKSDLPATIRWDAYVRQNFDNGLAPGANISLSHRWREIEYNTGLDFRYSNFGDSGIENVYDADNNLIEQRIEDDGAPGFEGFDLFGYLNASTWWGDNFIQLNTKMGTVIRDEFLINTRTPLVPASEPVNIHIETERRDIQYELGVDGERLINDDLLAKAIVLFFVKDQYPSNARRTYNSDDTLRHLRVADIDTLTMESIARMEFTWAGLENHNIQFNLEGAYNVLDNKLVQTDYSSSGSTIVNVPGSNSQVEELRGDFFIRDTWTLNNFSFEYGLGGEISRISQQGDSVMERDFFFLKPYTNLIYAPSQQQQTRLRIAREVSQLDFYDFVSATVYRDDNLALGNPNLRPETTWITEFSHEKRFGDLGVISFTLFHHWISDVEDLIPLLLTFEAPGNIGDGKRWGVELESTIPLHWLGLNSARLDIKGRWQDSVVTDPVTNFKRILSAVGGNDPGVNFRNENKYAYTIGYRQDFQASRVSWGWDMAYQAERPLFKVIELDVYHEGHSVNTFIETTRWLGLKFRLDGQNLLDYDTTRERTIYTGSRDLTAVDYREMRFLNNGRRFLLTVSGTF